MLFLFYFDQINATLLNVRDFFQKHLNYSKLLMKSLCKCLSKNIYLMLIYFLALQNVVKKKKATTDDISVKLICQISTRMFMY